MYDTDARSEMCTSISSALLDTSVVNYINLGYLLKHSRSARQQIIAIDQIIQTFKLKKYKAYIDLELDYDYDEGKLSICMPYPDHAMDNFINFYDIKPSKNLLATNSSAPTITCDFGFSKLIYLKPYQIPELIEVFRKLESLWDIDESIPDTFFNEIRNQNFTLTSLKKWLNDKIKSSPNCAKVGA